MNAKLAGKLTSNYAHDREGNLWDLTAGKVVSNAPRLPEGMTYPSGPDGLPDTSRMVSVPGAFEGMQSGSMAQASGAAAGGIGQYQSKGGGLVPDYGVNAAGPLPRIPTIMGGALQPGAPPVGQPPPGQPPPGLPPLGQQPPGQVPPGAIRPQGVAPQPMPPQMPPQAPQAPFQSPYGQTSSNAQIQTAGGQRIAALP